MLDEVRRVAPHLGESRVRSILGAFLFRGDDVEKVVGVLSGGEKALTAIALVFSMFQLNPAPFCMLDEVDAPLDDTNTERYANMVKRMSAQTQFIFISHSKITMEFAQQLVGVTMQEQGVSRVVEVDIEEALRLADEQQAA